MSDFEFLGLSLGLILVFCSRTVISRDAKPGVSAKKSPSKSPRNINITHFSLSFQVMASVVALYSTNLILYYSYAYVLIDNIDGALSISLGPLKNV